MLVEAVSGQVLNRNDVEPSSLDPVEALAEVRRKLNETLDDGDWAKWGRWFLADPASRTISPFSRMTVAEYVENRIQQNTAWSLAEAEEMTFGNTELLLRISAVRRALQQKTKTLALVREGKLADAEALFRESLADLRTGSLPDDPALAGALAELAENLLDQGKYTEAEPLARECLTIRERRLPGDRAAFDAGALLGKSLFGQKKYHEAQ